jgi:hypothetical protein
MRAPFVHRLTPLAVVASATAVILAGCSTGPPRALPEGPTGTPTATAPNTPPAPTGATRTPSQSGCLGAVVHTVDATRRSWPPACVAVGGLLRFEHLGPGYLDANSWDKVDCAYEGGVHECRLIHTGTVRFTVTNSHGRRPLTVMVSAASSPPKPSPACTATVPYPLDASYGGPPWRAICVKVGAVLRVENLGPEGFSVTPPNFASCTYEAAVRECRLSRAGTLTFTTRVSPESERRTLTVVVIA